jgi:hypothetical protein
LAPGAGSRPGADADSSAGTEESSAGASRKKRWGRRSDKSEMSEKDQRSTPPAPAPTPAAAEPDRVLAPPGFHIYRPSSATGETPGPDRDDR